VACTSPSGRLHPLGEAPIGPSWLPPLTTAAFVALVCLAGWSDIRTRRIPNILTLSGLIMGLVLRAMDGLTPLAHGLAGAGVALLIALPFFAVRALGGGDVKLLVAIGAFMGEGKLVGALLLIAVLGGVIAIVESVRRGVILPVLMNSLDMMKRWATLGRAGAQRSLATPGAVSIPYGVAIALGSVVWWFWGGNVL
jgi:prepilin peptidase CpaA